MSTRKVKSTAHALSRTNRPVLSVVSSMDSTPYTAPTRRARDGLENVVAGLGTGRDKMSHTHYSTPRTLTRYDLENMFRVSWLAKRIVNGPAEDMTREWRTVMFESETDKDQKAVEKVEELLCVKEKVTDAIRWGRLYGGALLIIGTDDADMSLPLDIESIGQDDLKWLQVIDRWRVSPSGQRTTDLQSPNFGKPDSYTLAESAVVVHHSRVIRFDGQKLPYFSWLQNGMWDDSELQHVYSALQSCDVVTAGIATMIFEANVDVITVPELNELAASKDGEAKITKRFQLAALMKSFNRTLLLSEGETYDKKANNFANLDKIWLNFQVNCCGAADMPMTRLFGQSAAGLNATGDNDIRNYYDRISAEQEADLRPKLAYLDQILVRSALGNYPEDYCFEFNSLWQMSDSELATLQKTRADRDKTYIDSGVLSEGAVARELMEDGTYKTLTKDDVKMAEELSLPMDENGNVTGKPTLKPTPEEVAAQAAALKAKQNPEGKDTPPAGEDE